MPDAPGRTRTCDLRFRSPTDGWPTLHPFVIYKDTGSSAEVLWQRTDMAFAGQAVVPNPARPSAQNSARQDGEHVVPRRRMQQTAQRAFVRAALMVLLVAPTAAASPLERWVTVPAPDPGPQASALASWYGPGFYGRTTASGERLQHGHMNVAHRSLPFGTRITFYWRGRSACAVVNDRGPFIHGRVFDLGPGTATALRFGGVGVVGYRFGCAGTVRKRLRVCRRVDGRVVRCARVWPASFLGRVG